MTDTTLATDMALIRVLLVDDEELFRQGVAVMINAQPDMEVVAQAPDGARAVALTQEHRPDVVLMDIRMPDMDGVEATKAIFAPERAAAREQPVRVIVLTTFNLDDRAATAIRYGASGFLLKDATPQMLPRRSALSTAATRCCLRSASRRCWRGSSRVGIRCPPPSRLSPPRSAKCSMRWQGGCPTPRSAAWSSPANRRSRLTSGPSCANSACATGCRSSSSPTSTA